MNLDFANMPETQRLAEAATLLRRVEGDAKEVARILVRAKGTPQKDMLDRWRPVMEEAVAEVVSAEKVLRRSIGELRAKRGQKIEWGRATAKNGWLASLLQTAGALTGLLVRMQAFEIEGRSVDQLNTLRIRALTALPPSTRAALLAEESTDG
jgi:hypothetical protein